MERILRSEEMAEIVLLPIRHHSPACAWHVKKMIAELSPAAVLVEGPENANALIPVLVHEETRTPLAVYYSYRDSSGLLSEEKADYKCYYPFLDYSPELAALREGKRLGIPVSFIDLPYGEILASSSEGKGLLREEEKNNYNDDYLLAKNEYIRKLCEKTGLRNFDEFWEKYFELNGLSEDSETLFSHLYTYCKLARDSTPQETMREDGCLKREEYMAAGIVRAAREAAAVCSCRILVVTGGFHTPGLIELLRDENGKAKIAADKKADLRVPLKDQNVYPMPYSMEAADALNGYASGMPFPGFYQRIWEGLEGDRMESAYEAAVLELLVSSGKEIRKKEGYLSTYDEICACAMARGLAQLRGKPAPGAYELLDAALSSYVKGEYNLSTDAPMRVLRKQMTGRSMGKLCADADMPPIIMDFEESCQRLGIKNRTTLEQEVTLSVFSSAKHRQISMLLHRMLFLETNFARKMKGPNLQQKQNRNLLREIWKYKWSTQVTSALIDVSVHGATVSEACSGLVKLRMKKDMGAKEAAVLLTSVFEMGLKEQLTAVYDRSLELMMRDTDFYSLSGALSYLTMMEELESLYHAGLQVGALITVCLRRVIALLPSMGDIKDENLGDCMKACKLLYQLTGREEYQPEREQYYGIITEMALGEGIHPGLHGCVLGILYGCGKASVTQVEMSCRGYLTGTREQMLKTAVFFRGLFYTARDLVFIGGQFLGMLDGFLGNVGDQEFMELLPELKMAFSYFTPREIDRIAESAAGLHGGKGKDIRMRREVLPSWSSYGRELDAYGRRQVEGNSDSGGEESGDARRKG